MSIWGSIGDAFHFVADVFRFLGTVDPIFTGPLMWDPLADVFDGVGDMMNPPTAEYNRPTPASGLDAQTSSYGRAIPYFRGRTKIAGNLIWYGNFQKHGVYQKVETGKGDHKHVLVGYTYTVSLAFGLCLVPDGCSATLIKAWKGSQPFDTSGVNFYDGNQTQPNSHMAGYVSRAPTWRRLCYVVLPNFDLGSGTYIPNMTWELQVGADADVLPTVVTRDILTDTFFGAGLDPSIIDTDAEAATAAYCTLNNLKFTLMYGSQISVLDALKHVISHHDGFITYFNGKVAHKQLKKTTDPLCDLDDKFFVRGPGEAPVTVSYPGGRDKKNRIRVEYTKRDKEYVGGIAQVEDLADIDRYGLKDQSIRMDGITNFDLASKMAMLRLRRGLASQRVIEFKVGPELAGIEPGDCFTVTLPELDINTVEFRASSIRENDKYESIITAVEEIDIYDLMVTGYDSSFQPLPPDFTTPAGSVVRPLIFERPAMYSGGQCIIDIIYSPDDALSWAGAYVYRSYTLSGLYENIVETPGTGGITGEIIDIGEDYIDVLLDWDASLSSVTDFDALISELTRNLMFVRTGSGDVFMRYQTVDLIGTLTWRLSGLIYDCTGFPRTHYLGSVAIGNSMAFDEYISHELSIDESDRNRLIYYKLPSVNLNLDQQSLADVTAISIQLRDRVNRPLPPVNISVNDVGLTESNAVRVDTTSDAVINWYTRNRTATGSYNFERSDTIVDDADKLDWYVEIYSGATLKRTTIDSPQTTKTYTYTAANRSTDGNPSPVTIKVYQRGLLETSDPAVFTITYA